MPKPATVTNKLMDGFGKVSNKLMGGLKRTTGGKRTTGQTGTGSGWWMTGNSFALWEPEEVGQVGFSCLESLFEDQKCGRMLEQLEQETNKEQETKTEKAQAETRSDTKFKIHVVTQPGQCDE